MTSNGFRAWAAMRLLFALTLAIAGLLVATGQAAAHEGRVVGDFKLVVGFMNEPAYVEQPNGLDLRVLRLDGHGHDHDHDEDEAAGAAGQDHHEGEPVEGLADTLRAEIIYGDASMPLTLRAVWGQPGAYTADVIPTAEGTYSFRIFGTIEGMEIDETFTGGPDTFSEVESPAAIAFPGELPSVGTLATQVADASAAADGARLFGIAGLIAGALGLMAGLGAIAMARSGRATPAPEARPASSETAD